MAQLWRTAGTAQSTGLLVDIETANAGSDPGRFAWADGVAYFLGQGGVRWRSDGTTAGTQPFPDPPWDWWDGFPLVMPIGRALFYFADSELWQVESAGAAPTWLADLGGEVLVDQDPYDAWAGPAALAWNGELWFLTHGPTDALWRTDGTADGTSIVHQASGWLGDADAWPAVTGGALYFVDGTALWRSDGTSEGTQLVKDLSQEAGFAFPSPSFLVAAGGRIFFEAFDDELHAQLLTSEGSEAGTVALHRAAGWKAGPPVPLGDGVVFDVAGDLGEREVWWSDGTEGGTHRLAAAASGPTGRVWELARVGSTVFFVGDDAEHGRELWKTDGSEAGTVLVLDVVPGPRGAHVRELAAWGPRLVFTACDDETGCEPWTSDGTAEGTQRLADLVAGPLSSDPDRFASDGTRLVFAAGSEQAGRELWWVPEPDAGSAGAAALVSLLALRRRGPARLRAGRRTPRGGSTYAASPGRLPIHPGVA